MLPEHVPNPAAEDVSNEAFCRMALRWGLDPQLLFRIMQARAQLPFDLWIFSGARSRAEQARVGNLDFAKSTHADQDERGCPRAATGADVQPVSPGIRLTPAAVAMMGSAFVHQGLRWGGGAPVDDTGIPAGNERWHVDLGPR